MRHTDPPIVCPAGNGVMTIPLPLPDKKWAAIKRRRHASKGQRKESPLPTLGRKIGCKRFPSVSPTKRL